MDSGGAGVGKLESLNIQCHKFTIYGAGAWISEGFCIALTCAALLISHFETESY